MERGETGSEVSAIRSPIFRIWAPPCSMAILIFLLSSAPGSYYPEHPDILNNLFHFLEFGLLGFLLARAFHLAFAPGWILLIVWTIASCAAFGLLDEAHQFLVPQRVFDLVDLGFDILGAVTGTTAFFLFAALKRRREHGPSAGDGHG